MTTNDHDFWATIAADDPRAADWLHVYGSLTVPIHGPLPELSRLPGIDTPQRVYALAWELLDEEQTARLVAHLAGRFNIPAPLITQLLPEHGVPLLAHNLTITIRNAQKWVD